jgi:hypothetical protein
MSLSKQVSTSTNHLPTNHGAFENFIYGIPMAM